MVNQWAPSPHRCVYGAGQGGQGGSSMYHQGKGFTGPDSPGMQDTLQVRCLLQKPVTFFRTAKGPIKGIVLKSGKHNIIFRAS